MIHQDERNYRIHNDKNKKLINKSLKELGAGRSILINADEKIIAGNGTYEQAQKLNIPVRVIETDGSELIAVKRTDIGENDIRGSKLAIMDNSTTDSSEFNYTLLGEDWDKADLAEIGIDLPEAEAIETPVVEDISDKTVTIKFTYKDEHPILDAFIREMTEKYPELMEKVEIDG